MSKDSAIDDDPALVELIQKLGVETGESEPESAEPTDESVEEEVEEEEVEPELSVVGSEPEPEEYEPELEIVPDLEPEPEVEADPDPDDEQGEEESQPGINLSQTYDDIVSTIKENYEQDRQQIEEFRAFLDNKIRSGEESRILFESLGIALRTKAETAATMVKLLDNVSKRMDKSSSGSLDMSDLLGDDE